MAVVASEGTTLGFETTVGGGTYTTLGQVLEVTPPNPEVAEVKTTNLSSAQQTYRPGKIPDMGQVKFKIQYDPADTSTTTIRTRHEAGTTFSWEVTYVGDGLTTHSKETFSAFVVSFEPTSMADETNAEADLTLRVTGAITRTAGS